MTYPEIQLKDPDPLATYELHYRTLRGWHLWLTMDPDTERFTGEDLVPCSRYGRTGNDCAYWAIACECIYVDANGRNDDDDPREAMDFYMSLAVNDSDEVLDLVRENWHAVPDVLKPYLEYDEDGLTMSQYVALKSLCHRYGVEFNTSDYGPQFDLPPDYVAGWIGGIDSKARTIYVGCDGEGRVSS